LYPKDKKSVYKEEEIEIVGPVKIDSQKRILLPLPVRGMFSGKEVVLLKIKDWFELWDYSRWKEWKEKIKKFDRRWGPWKIF
jgi:DNA-binding transcriptional regulator/RsmH inhibitor MraZ